MRRIGNIIDKVASVENIEQAIHDALKHRGKNNALSKDAKVFLLNKEKNIQEIRYSLLSGAIGTLYYKTFFRTEHGKRRKIDWNPSFRDNVIQHALFNEVGKRIVDKFITNTFSGIEGRGSSYGKRRIQSFLETIDQCLPIYILKLDIRHYYQSVNLSILKNKIRSVVKDKTIIEIFDQIIDSHQEGLPIGNYISQLLANLYLNDLDHWVTEVLGFKGYFRYCDDIIIIHTSKVALWSLLKEIKRYVKSIDLTIKPTAQVYPIDSFGLDFMGFVFHRESITLRKRIERGFRSSINNFNVSPEEKIYASIAAYYGWTTELTQGYKLWKRVVKRTLKDCLYETRGVQ